MKPLAVQWIMGGMGSLALSAAARALPAPEPMGSRVYLFFYNFAHILLANFDKVKNDKPGA